MAKSELPKDWGWKRLGDLLVEIKSGFACSKKQATNSGIPHLRTNNIGLNGELNLSQLVYLPPELVDSDIYNLRAGDVLFNNTNSTELVGKTAIVRGNLSYAFSNHITRLRARNDLIDSRWLALSLRCLWHKRVFAKGSRRWIGQAGFNSTMLGEIEIPIPPLEEQRRIVARIEELLSRLEQAKSLRQNSLTETSAIMPTALHETFVSAERMGWDVTMLESIIKLTSGNFLPSKNMQAEGPYPVYGGNGIIGYHTEYLFEEPKVIIGRVGAKCGCIHITQPKSWITDNALYVKEKSGNICNEYLALVLIYLDLRQYAKQAAQPVVSQKLIYPLQIPLPPLDEQRRIVTYLDHLQEKITQLKSLQEKTSKELKSMTQSILAKAFKGEL